MSKLVCKPSCRPNFLIVKRLGQAKHQASSQAICVQDCLTEGRKRRVTGPIFGRKSDQGSPHADHSHTLVSLFLSPSLTVDDYWQVRPLVAQSPFFLICCMSFALPDGNIRRPLPFHDLYKASDVFTRHSEHSLTHMSPSWCCQ